MPRCPQAPLCAHRYDAGRDGFIDLMELKLMMEKLGAPQTHLGLKNMIKEVDEDLDSKLSFREVSTAARAQQGGGPRSHPLVERPPGFKDVPQQAPGGFGDAPDVQPSVY